MQRNVSRVLSSMLVAFALAATALAVGTTASVPIALAQDAAADVPLSDSAKDIALYQSLADADLVAAWLDASTVSDEAAFLRVAAGGSYLTLRNELLTGLADVGRRNGIATSRLQRSQTLAVQATALDEIAASIQTDLGAQTQSGLPELSPEAATQATAMLAELARPGHPLGFSLDALAIAEGHLDGLRLQLQRGVEVLATQDQVRDWVQDAPTRLDEIREEVDQLRTLVSEVETLSMHERSAVEPALAELIATFPELHRLRQLAPTAVDGLPLVTVDAYIRGAQDLGSCPVDWSLLAGIGRVESRHGTLDDASILANGRVSQSILGPLLDGGATEREAEEAQALAEAEVLAAESQAAAEAEALDDWYNAEIWGEREEEVEEPDVDPLYGLRDEPEEEIDPLYGDIYLHDPDRPRLNDNDAQNPDAEESGDDAESGEGDDRPEGNGFAVIVDTDNGRLDGNDRWDRAVGPMQFIPETWSNWGSDGNGDGVVDPQNIYDAARSAGRFLCDLSTRRGPSPQTFVLGYNSSSAYVRDVTGFAAFYGATDLSVPGTD